MTGWQPVKRRASQLARSKPLYQFPLSSPSLWIAGHLGHDSRVKHDFSHPSNHKAIGKTLR